MGVFTVPDSTEVGVLADITEVGVFPESTEVDRVVDGAGRSAGLLAPLILTFSIDCRAYWLLPVPVLVLPGVLYCS